MAEYRHTQTGYITAGASALGALVAAASLPRSDQPWLTGGALTLLLGTGILFSSLTVEIRDGRLQFYFGPGFWSKTFPLEDIAHHNVVRNPWIYGWGIRYTPRGWLYNVAGLDAVELQLKGGTTLRIGTDEPDALAAALDRARSQPEG